MIVIPPLDFLGWVESAAQILTKMVGLIGVQFIHLATYLVIIGNKHSTQTATHTAIITAQIVVIPGMIPTHLRATSFRLTPNSIPIMMVTVTVIIPQILSVGMHVSLIMARLILTA